MKRYFIHLAYDGTEYKGWQVQPNDPSVQGSLEEALSTLLGDNIAVTGAGRTDTGVHASSYYAHFEHEAEDVTKKDEKGGTKTDSWKTNPADKQFIFKLNRFLAHDIVIYDIYEVTEDMHARFSAVSRSYEYRITSRKPLFDRLYSHFIYGKLDIEKISKCCKIIEETEDFESFARLHSDVKNHLCHVEYARWNRTKEGYVFEISANRFLRNMVRSLAGTLIDVGMGKTSVEDFRTIVEARDRGRAGQSAPAKGLFLTDVEYPAD